MNEEIPYNPPGQDAYILEGARQNQRLLDKWRKENPGNINATVASPSNDLAEPRPM